jgi:REP element-mobilizing transposase RayT
MPDDARPHRKSIRLRGHDYGLGGEYFVTVCTRDRRLFLEDARLRALARQAWDGLPARFPGQVTLDAFVSMPNHVHGIIVIVPPGAVAVTAAGGKTLRGLHGDGYGMGAMNDAPTRAGAMNRAPTPGSGGCKRVALGEIVRALKAFVTHEAHKLGYADFGWQRGYYEHIIEDEKALHAIRWYIEGNPERWQYDSENPEGEPDLRERMFLKRIRSRLI